MILFRCKAHSLLVISIASLASCVTPAPYALNKKHDSQFCKPSDACWPTPRDWQEFGATLVGKLEIPRSPLIPCRTDAAGEPCAAAMKALKNPFFVEDQAASTQSSGWHGAWNSSISAYAVTAKDASDVIAAVNFARVHRLRLVIKGTGHDYLGRSSAPDSLLVWTHEMRNVTSNDNFVPVGCNSEDSGVPAVTVEAGTRWIEAYQEVTVKRGRYVQGGGCTSVGAAGGFLQGGGFGSWSKKFGTAAANLIEAEIVTADGRLLVANSCQNQDLFWALRGGGGGTFGVVTKATLRTHPLPKYFGWINGSIKAKNDEAFKELLEYFIHFYQRSLSNEHWGEQVKIKGDNSLELALAFQGLNAKEAETVWKPLRSWIDQHPKRFEIKVGYSVIPGEMMWNYAYISQNFPGAIQVDHRPGQPTDLFWWSGGDAEQVSMYWYAYESRWIPEKLFEDANAKEFALVLFDASRQWPVGLHFNKGQAGASPEAIARGHDTSMNPQLYHAAALAIVAAGTPAFPEVPGRQPNSTEAESKKAKVTAAMAAIRKSTPDAGAYANEADYFEIDWQRSFWGENYPKLLSIKRKYDPDRMFICHHCVGSE